MKLTVETTMQKLSKFVNTSAQSSECKKPLPNEGLVEKVWTAGALIFGDKWFHKHGDLPGAEWNSVFLAFDENQIAAGLKRMRKDAEHKIRAGDEPWPPTAFEFACYCKTVSSTYFPDAQIALPPPRPSKEFAEKKIAEIRQKLKFNQKQEDL